VGQTAGEEKRAIFINLPQTTDIERKRERELEEIWPKNGNNGLHKKRKKSGACERADETR